jgi:hypothetical protein
MSITRRQVIARAASMWPANSVPYSQEAIHQPTGYRQDCSGFASMCWAIPPNAAPGGWGGLSTVTLVTGGWIYEISPSDLRPGDAVGICGPGSAGDDGHIVIFERWASDAENESAYWMYEQAGGRKGPVHRVVEYPYGGPTGAWRAYRFRDITDGGETVVSIFDEKDPTASRPGRTYGQGISDAGNYRDWRIGNAGSPVPGSTEVWPRGGSPDFRERVAQDGVKRLEAEVASLHAKVDKLATGGVDVAELAAAIVAKLPAAPSVAEITKAVADEHARRAKE